MRTRFGIVGLVVAIGLITAACGEGQKVGSEQILDIEEGNVNRLGERTPEPEPEGTPNSLTIGSKATPKPTPRPQRTPPVFDVQLTANSPFYKPGNALRVFTGITVRVTNVDRTPERSKGRSFTDKAGSFSSGMLKPGQSWTWVFDAPGQFEIIDLGLPFASAGLEVVRR